MPSGCKTWTGRSCLSRPPRRLYMQLAMYGDSHHEFAFMTQDQIQEQSLPRNIDAALQDPKWKEAVFAEFNALKALHSWIIVPIAKDQKPLPTRWVFKVKTNASNVITKYKARLVVQGCFQKSDAGDYYAPVMKRESL